MNPSLSDNAAQVASTTISALKETPAMLTLVIFNLLFIGVLAFFAVRNNAAWSEETERLHSLVAKCMGSFKLQSDESRPFQLLPRELQPDSNKPEQIPDLKPKL